MDSFNEKFGNMDGFRKETMEQDLGTLSRSGMMLAQGCAMGLQMKRMGLLDKAKTRELMQLADMLAIITEAIVEKKHEAGLITDEEYAENKAALEEAKSHRKPDTDEAA